MIPTTTKQKDSIRSRNSSWDKNTEIKSQATKRTNLNLFGIIETVMKIIYPYAEKRRIKFQCFIDTNIEEKLSGDSENLQQALSQLILSMIKYSTLEVIELKVALKNKNLRSNTLVFSIKEKAFDLGNKIEFKNGIIQFTQQELIECKSISSKKSDVGSEIMFDLTYLTLKG